MGFQNITKIMNSDGSPTLYFIDGERFEHIYDDTQLVRHLLGDSVEELWLKSSDELDHDDMEALWTVSDFDELDDLKSHLKKYPEIVEDT